MFPTPAATSHVRVPPCRPSGFPWTSATGPTTSRPVSITQASVEYEPISRLARDAVSVVTAQERAAPSPPRIAITTRRYLPPTVRHTGHVSSRWQWLTRDTVRWAD